MENLLLYVGIAFVLFVVFRLVTGSKDDGLLDNMLDISRFQMTDSQIDKASDGQFNIEYLLKDGFSMTVNSPDRITLELTKENYFCQFNNYYELEGRKVKKVVAELIGEWEVGKKKKAIKGSTNDAYQKWLDFDGAYEEALEAEDV